MKTWFRTVMLRELRGLRREIEAYPGEAELWRIVPGIANSGGTLALHLAGNLQYFVGAVLGGTGYVRDRNAEFSARDLPRADLLAEIDRAMTAVEAGIGRLDDARLDAPYPEPVAGIAPTTGGFLSHLAVHLAYHLGQVDYHRRIVSRQGTTVNTVPVKELV